MTRMVLVMLVAAGLIHAAPPQEFDVVVYGATASGVMAAVAAAEHGMHVALLEPGNYVGGMVSGGLSNSDVTNQEQLIGGLSRHFFASAGAHYHQPVAWAFEPHVAEQIFLSMLREAGVRTSFHCQLASIEEAGSRIRAIRTEDARQFSAAVYIDSRYEGDLMKAAGVSYVVGREGRSRYGEPLAGRQDLLPSHHQFRFAVSADSPGGGLLPFVVPQEQVAATGEGDGRFQSYCFRLCLTDRADNRLPITGPPAYDASRYALAARYLQSANRALSLHDFLGIVRIPNGKADINSTGPVSTDLLGASWEYPEATVPRRKQIADEHRKWAWGLLYFLQNDAPVPESIRKEAREWGWPGTSLSITATGRRSSTCAKAAACWANTHLLKRIWKIFARSTIPSAWPAITSIFAKWSGWRTRFITFPP